MQFSIIIPVYNEAKSLPHSLKQLKATFKQTSQVEIIICDGGSFDESYKLAGDFSATVLHTAKGRALQMNAGASHANGEWLLFLHADTQLPNNWMHLIRQCNGDWGRFDVRLSGSHWLFRVIEKAMNFRSRKTSIATGDQALFFRQHFFQKLGGYPVIPLMEDIAISKLARSYSAAECIPEKVITSSRRWEKKGIIRTMMLMWYLRLAYWLGIKPDKLHRIYYS